MTSKTCLHKKGRFKKPSFFVQFWRDKRKAVNRLIRRYAVLVLLYALRYLGEFKHEVRQFQKPYDNQQAEQISLMV